MEKVKKIIGLRINSDIYNDLLKACENEKRSLTNMIQICVNTCKNNGSYASKSLKQDKSIVFHFQGSESDLKEMTSGEIRERIYTYLILKNYKNI